MDKTPEKLFVVLRNPSLSFYKYINLIQQLLQMTCVKVSGRRPTPNSNLWFWNINRTTQDFLRLKPVPPHPDVHNLLISTLGFKSILINPIESVFL